MEDKMKIKSMVLIMTMFVVLLLITQCSPAPSGNTTTSSSSLDGKSLVAARCTACHNLDRVQSAHKDANGWKTTVERMVGKGAQLTAEEQSVVIDYLAKTYP
jgi:hypothetical protein